MKNSTNQPKHTHGEWTVQQTKNYGFRIQSGGKIICWERQDNYDPQQPEEAEANAQLISAAPDMYEALKKIKVMIEEWEAKSQKSFNAYCHVDAHIEMDEAIQKAEGKNK